ncbi:MAG: hypothetical protein ACTS8R_03140 [Arsenophonus sp. NC-QC1-MAG3]
MENSNYNKFKNKIWSLINSGEIKLITAKTYPLEQLEKEFFME